MAGIRGVSDAPDIEREESGFGGPSLRDRFASWRAGRISFAEFDASVQGWINHAG